MRSIEGVRCIMLTFSADIERETNCVKRRTMTGSALAFTGDWPSLRGARCKKNAPPAFLRWRQFAIRISNHSGRWQGFDKSCQVLQLLPWEGFGAHQDLGEAWPALHLKAWILPVPLEWSGAGYTL